MACSWDGWERWQHQHTPAAARGSRSAKGCSRPPCATHAIARPLLRCWRRRTTPPPPSCPTPRPVVRRHRAASVAFTPWVTRQPSAAAAQRAATASQVGGGGHDIPGGGCLLHPGRAVPTACMSRCVIRLEVRRVRRGVTSPGGRRCRWQWRELHGGRQARPRPWAPVPGGAGIHQPGLCRF